MSHLQCLPNQNNITDPDLTLLWFRLADFLCTSGQMAAKETNIPSNKWQSEEPTSRDDSLKVQKAILEKR